MEKSEREIEVVKVSKITGVPEQCNQHWFVPVDYKRKSGELEQTKIKCASKREATSIYIGFSFMI